MNTAFSASAALFAMSLTLLRPALAEDASRSRASVLAGITALDNPITCSATKIPLGELVQKVADDTGASLAAAWDVADEPVAVVVREMPARRLLEERTNR
jgi:hypothetical protein